MRPWVLLPVLMLGCDNPVEPDMGAIFQPVKPTVPTAPAPASSDAPTYDFDADARDEDEAGTVEPADDGEPVSLAEALGYAVPVAAPEPEPEVLTPTPTPTTPAWTPSQPIRGDWGVTVLSTTPQAQPPVAVLRFANGPDTVVHPGDLLADQGLVIMAIGKDAVQIARVSTEGDHAKVTSEIVPMLSRAPMQLTVQ